MTPKIVGANVPRFDHDPVTRECKGLLIEEQRQNMFPYTTTPGDSGWTSSKAGTFTQNTTETAAPDGPLGGARKGLPGPSPAFPAPC